MRTQSTPSTRATKSCSTYPPSCHTQKTPNSSSSANDTSAMTLSPLSFRTLTTTTTSQTSHLQVHVLNSSTYSLSSLTTNRPIAIVLRSTANSRYHLSVRPYHVLRYSPTLKSSANFFSSNVIINLFNIERIIFNISNYFFLFTCIVINGEKSAFNNSVFGKRRYRTIEAIIKSIYDKEIMRVSESL